MLVLINLPQSPTYIVSNIIAVSVCIRNTILNLHIMTYNKNQILVKHNLATG